MISSDGCFTWKIVSLRMSVVTARIRRSAAEQPQHLRHRWRRCDMNSGGKGLSLEHPGMDYETPSTSHVDNQSPVDDIVENTDVQPPEVVSTKGCGSRLPSRVEMVLKLKSKPLSQCKKCQEWGHHDSRNCDKFKEKEKLRSRRNSDV
ncbi:hypothetical protein SASPL_114981 [Salvia splendens]|uniref:Uncharacterized protein n=1 Tax=Salvia splendens TaxID=180675 RepID=A0A8X8Y748_SALSN|nr:hypothetical protein SASPL_114981 [Salvia splendens]